MPTFSVVIPAWNAAKFITNALDSVAAQTNRDYEIIVVDDGSPDDTAAVVAAWSAAHPQVALNLVRQANRGIGGSRNSGIRHSRGQFVAFLDADDAWQPEKLEAVARFLREKPEVDLVCHHEWLDRGNSLRRLSHGPHATYEDLLFGGNTISTSAVTVRRALVDQLGGFSEDMKLNGVEDYDLWLRLARDHCRIDYLPLILGTYRVHGQGFTANVDEHLQHMINVLQSHFDSLGEATRYYDRIRKRRAAMFRQAGHAHMLNGDRGRARALFRRSLMERAAEWRTWVLMLANELGVRR